MNNLQKITVAKKPDDRLKKLAGRSIEFLPGLNFIVGENGIGKSGLLRDLSIYRDKKLSDIKISVSGPIKTFFFDTEKMNPRVTNKGISSTFDVTCRFMSHGECMINVLKQFKDLIKIHGEDCLIIVDEPESGLSPWKQKELLELYKTHSKKLQIIVATHSLVFTRSKIGRLIELTEEKITYFDPPATYDWGV